tara:strand:+ start:168 stop:416 length:249 start_codon:yes stop_codon:yes gene_type:complete
MEFVLTMIMCAFVEGKTTCMPPHTFKETYTDGYSCMLAGYTKSYDKIVELGQEDVNKFNIYIKFGCNENQFNKTSISSKYIR